MYYSKKLTIYFLTLILVINSFLGGISFASFSGDPINNNLFVSKTEIGSGDNSLSIGFNSAGGEISGTGLVVRVALFDSGMNQVLTGIYENQTDFSSGEIIFSGTKFNQLPIGNYYLTGGIFANAWGRTFGSQTTSGTVNDSQLINIDGTLNTGASTNIGNITNIAAYNHVGISSLEGINNFHNLQSLGIFGNNITKLNGIQNLTGLAAISVSSKSLSFSGTCFSKIMPVDGYTYYDFNPGYPTTNCDVTASDGTYNITVNFGKLNIVKVSGDTTVNGIFTDHNFINLVEGGYKDNIRYAFGTYFTYQGFTGYISKTYLDTLSPIASVIYSTTGRTNQDVVATLTGYSEDLTLTNNSGNNQYVFTGNGTFSFEFQDVVGNTGTTIAQVIKIDKTLPTVNFVSYVDNQKTTSNTITLTGIFTDNASLSGFILDGYSYNINTGSDLNLYFSKTINLNLGVNTIHYTGYDYAGNIITGTINIIKQPTINNITSILSGTNQALIKFNSEYNLTGHVLVSTGIENNQLTGNITDISGILGTTHQILLSGLDTNTLYYYQVYGEFSGIYGDSSTINTFKTPKNINSLLTGGTILNTGNVIVTTGTLNNGLTLNLSGTNINVSSDNSDGNSLTGDLVISGINNIVVSGNSWDGVLLPPTIISGNNENATLDKLSSLGIGTGNGNNIVMTVKVGAQTTGTSLVASGGYFNIKFELPTYISGTKLDLYRSNDGINWEQNFPDSSCILNANKECSFQTNHLSYFAPVIDSTPNTFSFISQIDKELSQDYESNEITISGINTGTIVTITGGLYEINNGAYTGNNGIVYSGDKIKLKVRSSSSYSTTLGALITIGGVSAGFNVTTKSQPQTQSSGGGGSGGGGISYQSLSTTGTNNTNTSTSSSSISNNSTVTNSTTITAETRVNNMMSLLKSRYGDVKVKDILTRLLKLLVPYKLKYPEIYQLVEKQLNTYSYIVICQNGKIYKISSSEKGYTFDTKYEKKYFSTSSETQEYILENNK